ncbi:MAG: hypothetical protein GC161_00025 [Planctomycetaceae bacterium]|nr:hypothetical protein [Planctomycetaceae bacterium]
MLIRRSDAERIARGEVTLAFRRWTRPTVRSGGRLRTAVGELAIEKVSTTTAARIRTRDALAAGFPDRASLLAELDRRPDGQIYRIELHLAGPDPRVALRARARLTSAERAELECALARLDRFSRQGPWTGAVLAAIDKRPATLAAELAAGLGFERARFKTQVRKLKELGLTESLDVGYRLTPRAKAFLRE